MMDSLLHDHQNEPRVYNTFEPVESTSSSGLKTVSLEFHEYETYNTKHAFPITMDSSSQVSPSSDSLRSCLKCKKMYRETDNKEGMCCYHPGRFGNPFTNVSYANTRRWSCCKLEEQSLEGCVHGVHVEDSKMTGILNTFNVATGTEQVTLELNNNQAFNENTPTKKKLTIFQPKQKEKVPPPPRSSPPGEPTKHEVTKSDTLAGLSVRYNVKVEDIKRANKLFTNDIFLRKYLIIPSEYVEQ